MNPKRRKLKPKKPATVRLSTAQKKILRQFNSDGSHGQFTVEQARSVFAMLRAGLIIHQPPLTPDVYAGCYHLTPAGKDALDALEAADHCEHCHQDIRKQGHDMFCPAVN